MPDIKWTAESRTQLINMVAQQINAQSYLEIGVDYGHNYDHIHIPNKVGIDPVRGGTIRTTSDEFFANNTQTFDIIFIDGLHHRDQVIRDIHNSLSALNPGGVILLHDCLPAYEKEQIVPAVQGTWLGDVWKAIFHISQESEKLEADIAVVQIDYGCGMITERKPTHPPMPTNDRVGFAWENATYADYEENVHRLNLLSFDEACNWIKGGEDYEL